MSCHNSSHQQLPANVTLMSKIAANGLPLSYFASCVFLCGKFTFISSDHYYIIMLASVWLLVTFCNMYYVFYRDKGHHITYLCRHRVEEEVQHLLICNLTLEAGRWFAPRSDRVILGKDGLPIVHEAGQTSGPAFTA